MKSKDWIKFSITMMILCFYFAVIPYWITVYGIEAQVQGFDNGCPFYEIYSSFAAAWILGHLVVIALLFSFYKAFAIWLCRRLSS